MPTFEEEIKFEEKMVRYWKNKQLKYKKQSNKDMCEKNIQWGLKEIADLRRKMKLEDKMGDNENKNYT